MGKVAVCKEHVVARLATWSTDDWAISKANLLYFEPLESDRGRDPDRCGVGGPRCLQHLLYAHSSTLTTIFWDVACVPSLTPGMWPSEGKRIINSPG